MYESPVNIIYGEMQTQIEGDVFKAIQNVGIDVNKEELLKTLQYDRGQYEKGYSDGCAKAIDDFAEKIALEISESIIWGMLVDSDKDNSFSDTSDKIFDYVVDTAKKIAEELRGAE